MSHFDGLAALILTVGASTSLALWLSRPKPTKKDRK